jgi:hypothetical protein
LEFFTPENGTNRLFHNVGKELPLCAPQYPRRAEISPDDLMMQALVCFHMVWFGTSYVNLGRTYIVKYQILRKNSYLIFE